MATRTSKPVTVTLGPLAETAQRFLDSGQYASMSEIVRAGLRALAREDAVIDARLKAMVQEELDDPSPALPIDEAFAEIRQRMAEARQRDQARDKIA